MSVESHRYWYDRGYLPHCDFPGLLQFVTFRLADSMPQKVLDAWRRELADHPEAVRSMEEQVRVSRFLDSGEGNCYLRRPRIADMVQQAILHRDGCVYELHDWVVMPNHVHLLARFREGAVLGDVVGRLKSFTSHRANAMLGSEGEFWYRDYYDRFVRDEEHYAKVVRYIRYNPVKAGLCGAPEDWPWGSARLRVLTDPSGAGEPPAVPDK